MDRTKRAEAMGRVAILIAGALSVAMTAHTARADQPGANAQVVVSSPSGDPVVVAPAPLGASAAADSDSVFAKGPAFTVGVAGGFGAPEGYGGAAFGFEPNRWLSFELGGGSGGSFGPATAETVRVGIPIGSSQRIGLGVGASQNFLIKNPQLANAPPVAYFVNPEMFDDIRSKIGFGIRFSAGIGVLLNGASYPQPLRGGRTECVAGARRRRDRAICLPDAVAVHAHAALRCRGRRPRPRHLLSVRAHRAELGVQRLTGARHARGSLLIRNGRPRRRSQRSDARTSRASVAGRAAKVIEPERPLQESDATTDGAALASSKSADRRRARFVPHR